MAGELDQRFELHPSYSAHGVSDFHIDQNHLVLSVQYLLHKLCTSEQRIGGDKLEGYSESVPEQSGQFGD